MCVCVCVRKPLKLVDLFIFLGSMGKGMIALNRLSIMWKIDFSDIVKWNFFQIVAVSVLLYGYATWALE